MSELNPDAPAFPFKIVNEGTHDIVGFRGDAVKPGHVAYYSGIWARDYFATRAMPELLRKKHDEFSYEEDWRLNLAIECYKIADAMIEARNK